MARLGRGRRRKPIFIRGAPAAAASTTITAATGTNAALALTRRKTRVLGIAFEADSAMLIKGGDVALAAETDSSRPVTKLKRRTLGIAIETDSSRTITARKGVSRASETDFALSITPSGQPPPPVPVQVWRVDLHALNNSVPIVSGLPVQAWMFNYVLNAPGAFEAEVLLTHPLSTEANILSGAREIRVYRGTDLVWGGYLWSVAASASNYKLRLRGEGYFSRFRRRLIVQDLIKYDKDQADIAWDLIQYTQSTHGTFGITDGHIDTGVLIDHVYCATDFNDVGSAIDELSQMDNSFDFWITPSISDASNKVFKNATPRRGTSKAVTLNQTNALSAEYEIDSSDMANHIWGVGNGDCNPPEFEAQDASSITTYGELHETIQFEDLDHFPSVKAHTREELRLRKQPRRQVTIRMEERDYTWGSFDIGDIITLASNRGYISDSRQMRVLKVQVNFNPENRIAFFEFDLDSVIA